MDLPEMFDKFNESRKEGFIKIKKLKEDGKNIVGVYCAYTPKELISASGAIPIGLCGTSEEVIKDAERDLPRNLCPLIKSSYGFAITDKCPYFYFSDLLVGETTCDGKKKMYELLKDIKPVHVMQLPQENNEESSLKLWVGEVEKLKSRLEEAFGVEIGQEDMKRAIREKNEERRLMNEFFSLGKLVPPPISGLEMYKVINGSEFKVDRNELLSEMRSVIDGIRERYESKGSQISEDAPRILITGCPIGGVYEKIVNAIEKNGGVVVAYENCGGIKSNQLLVDEEKEPVVAIAEKYLKLPCSVMTPNDSRMDLISDIIRDYKIDGVVDVVLQACHTYNVETAIVKRRVSGAEGIPYMAVETDYSKADTGQLETRLEAFLEMLG